MRTSIEGRLLRLTLDRPERRNALDSATCRALVEAIDGASASPSVGAILLDAEGPVFCAGMDLDESLRGDASERNAIHVPLFTSGERCAKPIVAAVHGPAYAGGVGLIANAHVVVAAAEATFSLTEIKIGLWPFVVWQPLERAIGKRRLAELSLTGRLFSAAEAHQMGLVHIVVPAAEVPGEAAKWATRLAEASPDALARGFALMRSGTMDEAIRLRNEQFLSPDYKEGVRAFREKRKPRWPSLD